MNADENKMPIGVYLRSSAAMCLSNVLTVAAPIEAPSVSDGTPEYETVREKRCT